MTDDVGLKEHFEARLNDLDRLVSVLFKANDIAIAKAEQTMNVRMDGLNEFREAMKDQASRMITREEFTSANKEIEALRRDKANLDGRLVMLSSMVSVVSALLIEVFLRYIIR